MSNPLVSAIMPTFNGAKTVREAVDSVLTQSYSPLELIVVDDGSTDGTVDILRSYENRIRLHVRDSNSGICGVARGEAMALGQGKYHAFIDQDDLWKPTKIARQVEFMERHCEIPLCHTYMTVMDSDGNEHEVRHDGTIPPTGPCARELIRHCFITISSILVKPTVWMDAKRRVGMEYANTDTETFLHILQGHPAGFGFIPEVLGSYRRWPQSMSRQNWKWSPEDVNALDRVYSRGYWQGLLEKRHVRSLIAEAYWKNSEHWRHAGFPDRAWYFARRGLRYRPGWWKLYAAGAKAAVKMLKC